MALTYTRRELVFRALAELGEDAAGQTPSDEDVSAVDTLVDGMVDELLGRGVVYIDDPGERGPTGGAIDAALFLPLGSWLANAAAPEFGGQFSQETQGAIEARIRRIVAMPPTHKPMTAEHF